MAREARASIDYGRYFQRKVFETVWSELGLGIGVGIEWVLLRVSAAEEQDALVQTNIHCFEYSRRTTTTVVSKRMVEEMVFVVEAAVVVVQLVTCSAALERVAPHYHFLS